MLRHNYTTYDLDNVPDGRLSWRELLTIVRQQEPSGSSAVFRATHPRTWGYNLTVQAIMSMQDGEWVMPSEADVEPEPREFARPSDIRAKLRAVDDEIAARTGLATEASTGS